MTIHDFIQERQYLVWYVKDHNLLDESAIVEATLNYGDWDDVTLLIKILGMKKVAKIFREQTDPKRLRSNYYPATKHYFQLYFNEYA